MIMLRRCVPGLSVIRGFTVAEGPHRPLPVRGGGRGRSLRTSIFPTAEPQDQLQEDRRLAVADCHDQPEVC